jgi:hypothetical protein
LDHTRHSAIYNCRETPITLIGAGGIGALTAITLAKMGVPAIMLFDDDTVDAINIATQFHRPLDVERAYPKVEAVAEMIEMFSDETDVYAQQKRVDSSTPWEDILNPVIISAVDSIVARQEIWQVVKNLVNRQHEGEWYLDARMSAEVFQLYAVDLWNPEAMDDYDAGLMKLKEDDVPAEACTQKSTIYTACVASGLIGRALRQIVTGASPEKFLNFDIKNLSLFVPGA